VYTPVFAQPPKSWRDWWCAVREFAAGWHDIAPGEVRGYHPEADSLGRQLGVSLSPSVHEWAAFAADLHQAGVFRQALRDRFTLGWDTTIEAVTLLTLCEGDVCWGIPREHLADEDPPVDNWLLDPTGGRPPRWWRRHTPTTSQFALQHLIGYLHPAAGGFTVHLPPSPELVERLRSLGRTSIDLGGQVLIEDDDLVIMAGKSLWTPDEETDITVEVQIGASRIDSIPQLLVDLARRGGGFFHSTFIGLQGWLRFCIVSWITVAAGVCPPCLCRVVAGRVSDSFKAGGG
jgi:hypothetical protein